MRVLVLFLLLAINTFCYSVVDIKKDVDNLFKVVPENYIIIRNGKQEVINMRYLINMTSMNESFYGRDKYKGRIAKTHMQIEEPTYNHYVPLVSEPKIEIEKSLGRKLCLRDEDAVYIAYLVYIAKLKYHYDWLDKLHSYYKGDLEYYIYKIYFNSTLGDTTFSMWNRRKIELEELDVAYRFFELGLKRRINNETILGRYKTGYFEKINK